MFKPSDEFYKRKCYFKQEQVPTQTVMKKNMKLPLANVYFRSMTPALKILAGLEPPLKGGGFDWFMHPEDLLKGRAVLKPVKKEYLDKLGFNGIDCFGEKIVAAHRRVMEIEKRKVLDQSDATWKKVIEMSCHQQWDETSKEEAEKNSQLIKQAFDEFTVLYSTSLTRIEMLLFNAAIKEIERVRNGAHERMSALYKKMLEQQAKELYDEYNEKLMKEKERLKAEFIQNIDQSRKETYNNLHVINNEKHVAVEKLRHLLNCQNLACQIYVALKEREECKEVMEEKRRKHRKKIRTLREDIAMKDFEISLEREKEVKRQEFNKIWKKKICHVVKRFQLFVNYCINCLPEQAEFFLNMEKLMMLQLEEACKDPSAESIIEPETGFQTPVPRPHPFYLVCEKGYKPKVDQKLCPKHCTSSASQFPVIVVNKRYIYANCDNIATYTDKVLKYIYGQRGDESDFEDDHDYAIDVPVKITASDQLLELNLESSIMQILQQEMPNPQNVIPECDCGCVIPFCFCSPKPTKLDLTTIRKKSKPLTPEDSVPSGEKIVTRTAELYHEREPKWENYMDYIQPMKCRCAKTAKKHLKEHMPPYMKNMSKFDSPDLPNYETCSLTTLRRLVKKARGKVTPPPETASESTKIRDAVTQCDDREFEILCTCFSDDEIVKLMSSIKSGRTKVFEMPVSQKFRLVAGSMSTSYLALSCSTFATKRAFSLRNILDDDPEIEDIFKKEDCIDFSN